MGLHAEIFAYLATAGNAKDTKGAPLPISDEALAIVLNGGDGMTLMGVHVGKNRCDNNGAKADVMDCSKKSMKLHVSECKDLQFFKQLYTVNGKCTLKPSGCCMTWQSGCYAELTTSDAGVLMAQKMMFQYAPGQRTHFAKFW